MSVPARRRQRLSIVGGLILLTGGLVACTGQESPVVPRLPTGSKQVIEQASTDAGEISMAHANQEIHVVEKKGPIPADLVPVRWSTVSLDRASADIPITWTYGNCGKPNRETDVYVQQQSTKVTIDVWDDTRFDLPPGTSCAGVGLEGAWTIHLAKPLGTRSLELHVATTS